ncbi:mtDNA inheritance, partitioning of the mitochondrial organelle [Coemansia sp. RSA 2671]|nr:mtDNA inheritance, partitioning of the mitochondrial organelle [Coemansia sp. RSA 2675]KAJ2350339.1 mtDNA inheritance, partitioning of the mitochondrial organelle [Coemansia sp. RSA 2671]
MKEIITLQFGESANYVGTHYWNMQQQQFAEESSGDSNTHLAMDVFYSEDDQGVGKRGKRYTPRVLVFDKVGNFGSLGQSRHAQTEDDSKDIESEIEAAQWDGATEVHRQIPYASGAVLGTGAINELSESQVRYWSDFNEVEFNTVQSLSSVSGVEFGNSLGEMNTFQEGGEVFNGENGRDEILEGKFRVLAEACDQMQGFQVLADAHGGFAGFGAGFVEKVREEYPKSSILLYNVASGRVGDMGGAQTIDAAIGLATNLENVSAAVNMYVPSALKRLYPGVQIEESSRYQTSAFMATNVSQWSQCILAGRRSLDEMISQVTQQQYFKVAESLLSPGLQISDSKYDFGSAAGLLEQRFVASSGAVVSDLSSLAGQLVVDRGTEFSRLVRERYAATAYADLGQAVALPRSFPRRIFQGARDSVGVAGMLCTTAGTTAYVQRLHESVQVERSRHVKDYEREWIREVRGVLDSVIDRYATIS